LRRGTVFCSESWNKIEKARQAAFEAVSGRGGEDDEESEDDFADGAAVAAGGEHRMVRELAFALYWLIS
jgi:hypothetical protein